MDYSKRMLKKPAQTMGLKRPVRSEAMKDVDRMTADLVQEMMNAATSFHKLHLQVTGDGSYAQHKALNEIYDALPDLADSIAEGYQGACEMLLSYEPQGPATLESVDDAINYMRQLKTQVDELQAVMPHSEVVNNLDLVKDAINSAKYKLIFLA